MKKLSRLIATSAIALSIAIHPVSGWTLEPAYAAAAQSEIKVLLDDKAIAFSPSPVQLDGYTLVPMRPIFEALQAEVSWEPQSKTIFATKGGTVISLKLGSRQATVNGKSQQLDAPAQLLQGSTMVPLRFVSEALGAQVSWDGATRTIGIRSLEQLLRDDQEQQTDTDTYGYETMSFSEIVYRYDDSIVTIETDRGQGSGMVIDDRWVLTNFHVISDASEGTIELTNGESLKINGVLAYDEDADLAIIETASSIGALPVVIDQSHVYFKGDPVIAIGSPKGFRNTASEGVVSNIHYDGGVNYIQTTAAIDQGSSGGALFDEYGEVIGITTSMIPDTTANLNLAVSSEHVWPLIEQAQSTTKKAAFLPPTLPDSLSGATTAEIAKLMEEEFSSLWTEAGPTKLTGWRVNRDAKGWLVIEANIDPSFYMVYADKIAQDMRYWALNIGSELQRMLPNQPVEVLVHYEREFSFEPRGFAANEVTALGNGKWKVSYPVIQLQSQDRGHIKIGH